MKAFELYQELYRMYGPVTRARNCFLYTKKCVRLTDLYLENGRAILGWHGGSAFTQFKNILSRAQVGGFICQDTNRLQKAISTLLDSNRSIFYFPTKMAALKEGLSVCADNTAFYRPWSTNPVPWKDVTSVVIEPPLPWTDSLYILAVKTEALENAQTAIPSVPVPFALEAALARSIYNLIAELKEREEKDWFIYDPVVTKYWTRKGPYLYPKIDKNYYDDFVIHCLKNHILINPDYNAPSIVPFGADKGVFEALKKSPFDGGKE